MILLGLSVLVLALVAAAVGAEVPTDDLPEGVRYRSPHDGKLRPHPPGVHMPRGKEVTMPVKEFDAEERSESEEAAERGIPWYRRAPHSEDERPPEGIERRAPGVFGRRKGDREAYGR